MPISLEFGLSRAGASVASGLSAVCNGIMFPLAGWLSDKYGPKWIIFSGVMIMSAGLLTMNFVSSTWSYYLTWGILIGGGHGLGLSVAHDKLLTNWFVKKRGTAFGSRFAIMGVMELVALLFISSFIAIKGWRMTCLMCAGVIIGIGLLVALRFVKQERPECYGLLPDGAPTETGLEEDRENLISKGLEYAASFQETEFTLKEAMRVPAYWILIISFMIHGMVFNAFNLHCIPFLTDMGTDSIVAAGMMAMMVFFQIPSRFLGGIIADRFKKEHLKFLVALAVLLPAVGITLFLLNQTMTTVYIFLILFGLGAGAYTPLDLTIKTRYFGRKASGSIMGTSTLFSVPASFLSSVYVGWVHDITGSYSTVFTLFAVMAALGALMVCMIRVPKQQARTQAYISDLC